LKRQACRCQDCFTFQGRFGFITALLKIFNVNNYALSDEIRTPAELPEFIQEEAELTEGELKLAVQLVGNLTSEFKPEQYKSRYREALQELINAKINDQREIIAKQVPRQEKVVDLWLL